jgi:cytochrome o ubiquinol oxidase subunit 2
LGLAGISNVMPLEYDKYAGRGSVVAPHTTYLAAICTPMDHLGVGTSEPAQPLASQPSRPLSTAPATSPAG